MIDLTYGVMPNGSRYFKDPQPVVFRSPAFFEGGKLKSGQTTVKLSTHHGTHIDAPAHKIPGGRTIDQYPVTKFVNRACLLDLTKKSELTGLHQPTGTRYVQVVTKEDVEGISGLSELSAVVIRTGYDRVIESHEFNDSEFPYMEPEAAEYLAGYEMNIIGIDSFAFDPSGSNSESHRALLERDTLLLETIVNLHSISRNCFDLCCLPVLYDNADAAQTRAVVL